MRQFDGGEFLSQLKNNLAEYYTYCQNTRLWPYSTQNIIGKVERFILQNSQETLELPYPINTWPANLFKCAAEIYSNQIWRETYKDFHDMGQNYFIFPDVYIQNNMLYNPYII